jgi:NADH:ubiquinone oxidoreductase subunit K
LALFLVFFFFVFIITLFGIFLSRKNFILVLISLEILLLIINSIFVIFSVFYDDIFGQVFAFFLLTVAAGESALGLSLLVSFYRLRGGITLNLINLLKA